MSSQHPPISITMENGLAVFRLTRNLGPELFSVYRSVIDGARYHAPDKSNRAPIDKLLPILHRLKSANFEATLAPELRAELVIHLQRKKAATEEAKKRADIVNARLQARGHELFPFQRIGVTSMAPRDGFLLADEMGCGKSVTALAATPDNSPLFVICPAVMKQVWLAEAAKFRPELKGFFLEGRGSFRYPQKGEIVTINPDIMEVDVTYDLKGEEIYHALEPLPENMTVVFDEGHMYKDWKSKRTRKARAIAEATRDRGGRTWILTGTPLLGKPPELWSVLQLAGIAHEAFGTYAEFVRLFGGVEDKHGGMHWADSPDAEVPKRLQRVSIRREKKDVLPELPEKTYRILLSPIDRKTKKLADEAWETLQKLNIDLDSAEALADASNNGSIEFETIAKARAALALSKLPTLLELIAVFEDANEPVIVFSCHRAAIDLLATRSSWGSITGSNSKQAFATSELFQQGKLKGIAATVKAGGVGITLTKSCNVIFLDQDWTPALNLQAEDRACRIGQDRGVVITVLIADHTLDKHVDKVLRKKGALIAGSVQAAAIKGDVVPENDGDNLREDEIRTLFADTVNESSQDSREPRDKQLPEQPTFSAHDATTEDEKWTKQRLLSLPDNDSHIFTATEFAILRSLAASFVKKSTLTRKQWDLGFKILTGGVL